jgi:hypothetical protein
MLLIHPLSSLCAKLAKTRAHVLATLALSSAKAFSLGMEQPDDNQGSKNKNASNSRPFQESIARSYQHKALGELHRR